MLSLPAWRSLIPASGLVLLSSASGGMSADIFQLYVVQTLGYQPSLVGVIAAAGMVSIPLQLFAPRMVHRYSHRRVMLGGAALLLPALVVLLVSGAVTDQSRGVGAICLLAAAVAIEIAISMSFGAAWNAWVAEFTDSENRAVYISLSSTVSQLTIIAAFSIQTLCFQGLVPTVFYQLVIAYCIVYVMASLMVFRTLPQPNADVQAGGRIGLSDLLRLACDDRYRLMLGAAAGNFLIGVPLLAVYAITVLRVPSEFLGFILVLRTVTSFVATPLLGWLITRNSAQSIVRLAGFALTGQMIIWTALPVVRDGAHIMAGLAVLVVVFQVSKAAFAMALTTIEFETIDRDDRVGVFTLIDLTSSTALQLNMLVGAILVDLSARMTFVDTNAVHLDPVKLSCAVGAVVAAIITAGYLRLARIATTAGEVVSR